MFKTIKSIYESILIALHERKEARLYRDWLRTEEDKRHARTLSQAEQLTSRPAYRPSAVNEIISEQIKAA